MKRNGKGPGGGQEGCQTNAGLELVKEWGRGLGVKESYKAVQFQESLTKPMEILDPKSPSREVLQFPGMGLPYHCPALVLGWEQSTGGIGCRLTKRVRPKHPI